MDLTPRWPDGVDGRGRRMGLIAMVALAAGCGRKPPAVRGEVLDARAANEAGTGGMADAASPAATSLRVTVEWPTASAAVRASPGPTACGAPRPPPATIATLHGVSGVVVVVDGAGGGGAAAAEEPYLAIRDCALAPRVLVAATGATLVIERQDDRDRHVAIHRLGPAWKQPAAPEPVARAWLPIRGHSVTARLDQPGVWRVAAEGIDDPAYVVVGPPSQLGITDEVGQVEFSSLPNGTYHVTAWLPPAPDQPDQRATGQAIVAAGAAAELVLTLGQ